MPANKNALIRYKTIDNCLRNRYRRWTLEDLVEACSDAIYDAEDIVKGVSVRTVQGDIQIMRSDKLGYNAPIEVYEHKYYRYADENFSIMNMPMSENDFEVMKEAVDMLRQLQDFDQFAELSDVVSRLQDKLAVSRNKRKPLVHFDNVPGLKGLHLLNPLYNHIARKQTLCISYKSFSARKPKKYIICPYLLKEFRNRWFLFGSKASNLQLFNLALDRIVGIEVVDTPFRENPNFDSSHFFDDVIGVSKDIGSKPVIITFWASRDQSLYIQTKPIHQSQTLIRMNPEDHSCIFQITVVVNIEMYSIFMSYGPGIKILSPQNVASHIKSLLKKAADYYAPEIDETQKPA